MHDNVVAEALLEVVTLGNWAELHYEDVPLVRCRYAERLYIAPAPNGVIGYSKKVRDDGRLAVCAHGCSYGDHENILDLLIDCFKQVSTVMDMSWDQLDPQLARENGRNVPVIRLSQLNEAYHRAVKAHRLFAEYGLIEESKVTSHE